METFSREVVLLNYTMQCVMSKVVAYLLLIFFFVCTNESNDTLLNNNKTTIFHELQEESTKLQAALETEQFQFFHQTSEQDFEEIGWFNYTQTAHHFPTGDYTNTLDFPPELV